MPDSPDFLVMSLWIFQLGLNLPFYNKNLSTKGKGIDRLGYNQDTFNSAALI